MAKKGINIFTVSFLDLLSGALAAVIILFIIVPKLTQTEQSVVEQINDMDTDVSQLDSLIQLAQNSVPDSVFERMQNEINQINERIDSLRNSAQNMEQEISDIREQLEEAQREIQEMREQQARGEGGPGAAMFGVNADFAVVCTWQKDLDVDLWVKNNNTANNNNKWLCYRGQWQSQPWGKYYDDIRHRDPDDESFEMVYQENGIIPGEYEVYYHLFTDCTISETITGYAVIHPYTPEEKKIHFDDVTIRHNNSPADGGGYHVATLKITENNIVVH